MTDQERLDRQSLLKKAAAVAGAVYFAPVLTSAAGASTEACASQKCKPGPKGETKCAKKGGADCHCKAGSNPKKGTCETSGGSCKACNHTGPQCGPLEACGGNCGCFFNGSGANPGVCVDIKDGLCASFQPCNNGACPAGQCCFTSCCASPLCAGPCTGSGTGASSVRKGGAGMLFR
jgi:hypothetical protein